MSGRPFDRCVARLKQALTEIDVNRITGEGADAGLMHLLRQVGGPPTSLTNTDTLATFFGFYGASFLVLPTAPASTTLRISAGLGAKRDDTDLPSGIGGVAGLNELSDVKPIVLRNSLTTPVPPPPGAPDNRIDILEVAVRRDLYDPAATPFLQAPSATRAYDTVTRTLSYALDGLAVGYVTDPANSTQPIGYKIGQAAPVPTAPPTSPGYVKIAEITVENVVANPTGTIRQEHLGDFRPMLFLGGSASFSVTASFELGLGSPPTIVEASVPPGIRLAVSRYDVAGVPRGFVYALNNIRNAVLTASSPVIGAPALFDLVRCAQDPFVVAGSGDKTRIDDATLTFPAQQIPVGQPMRLAEARVFTYDQAVPEWRLANANPIVFTISGVLS